MCVCLGVYMIYGCISTSKLLDLHLMFCLMRHEHLVPLPYSSEARRTQLSLRVCYACLCMLPGNDTIGIHRASLSSDCLSHTKVMISTSGLASCTDSPRMA